MKVEEVDRCQIQNWYPKFKHLSLQTIIRQLPESFVEYLLQQVKTRGDTSTCCCLDSNFPEVESMVKKIITTFNGEVFPKLNWSSPKDYASISPFKTPLCSSVAEIFHLLTKSKSLAHDLHYAYDLCTDKVSSCPPKVYLALRRWYNLKPEMEFRCFVKARRLIAISQRNTREYYPSLIELKNGLKEKIDKFFWKNIRKKFESDDYTFDVYCTLESFWLVDFNPWCDVTLPLLFTWNQLDDLAVKQHDVVFRTVANHGQHTDSLCEP